MRAVLLGLATPLPLAAAVRADEAPAIVRQLVVPTPGRSIDHADARQTTWRSHFSIQKKHGLEYRHAISVGERDMIFAVHGPMITKKAFGLGFQIRF